jgi:hypothetical protein
VFRRGFDWPGNEFFISAALALPRGKHCVGIAGALIDGAARRNNLAAAPRAGAAARSAPVNIDLEL